MSLRSVFLATLVPWALACSGGPVGSVSTDGTAGYGGAMDIVPDSPSGGSEMSSSDDPASGGSATGGDPAGNSGGSGGSLSPSDGGSGHDGSGGETGTGGFAESTGGSGGSPETGGASNSGGSPSCTEHTWCNDVDRDGYTNPGDCVVSCVAPGPPYTFHRVDHAHGDDCYDGNVNARPNLEGWQHFSDDRGDGSWDYDCDGDEEPEFGLGSCLQLNVPNSTGWVDQVPECGEVGTQAKRMMDGQCSTSQQTARCR